MRKMKEKNNLARTGKIYLSVVIPNYNEEKNIKAGSLDEVYGYLKKQKYSWEVLLVDDGSLDNTVSLLNSFARAHKGFKVYKEPHRGKAGTVIAGMLKARGQIVLFADMDQATPLNQIEKFLPKSSPEPVVVAGDKGILNV